MFHHKLLITQRYVGLLLAENDLANNNGVIIRILKSSYFGVDNDSVLDYRRAR